ncbi:unnamed protein product, partial [Staurois parvus]
MVALTGSTAGLHWCVALVGSTGGWAQVGGTGGQRGWHWWAQVGGTGGHRWVGTGGWHCWAQVEWHRWVHCWAQVGGASGRTAGHRWAELVGGTAG